MKLNENIRSFKRKLDDLDWEIDSLSNYVDDIQSDISDLEDERNELLNSTGILKVENLNDREKFLLLKEIYNNCSLEEIQKLLNWKQGKGINYETIKSN